MTARQKFRTGCYYFFGVVWGFAALASLALAAALGALAWILIRAALIGAGFL